MSICPWHSPCRLIPDLSLRLTAARLCASAGVFFVPLNLLIAATSILAFIAGESSVSNDNTTFNIVVGCLAAFGVFWNSCDRMLGYKSRADMHTGAKMVCKELLADLDFALIKFKSFSAEEKKVKKNDPMCAATLLDIKTKIDQVQESCTSAVPDAINQIFKQMNTMVVSGPGQWRPQRCSGSASRERSALQGDHKVTDVADEAARISHLQEGTGCAR